MNELEATAVHTATATPRIPLSGRPRVCEHGWRARPRRRGLGTRRGRARQAALVYRLRARAETGPLSTKREPPAQRKADPCDARRAGRRRQRGSSLAPVNQARHRIRRYPYRISAILVPLAGLGRSHEPRTSRSRMRYSSCISTSSEVHRRLIRAARGGWSLSQWGTPRLREVAKVTASWRRRARDRRAESRWGKARI